MAGALSHQPSLLGGGDPAVDPSGLSRIRRIALDDQAWVEHLPGWVAGHEALLDHLARTTTWRSERRMMYELPQAIVATVSLGEPRKFLLRPKQRGRTHTFMLGWGDPIVMGGACQRNWEHSVPKVAHAWPRMAVMFRPEWKKP
ncbi:MAG TPA: alpha-ketoglutarate-dependent dioxygenase AlkB [Polyangia bacterium]|nr:alpha-ketoglutarate-dependent dioxygenase AlkB [Polyangia bacterium]